jgi:hypothetical protein
VQDDVLLSVVPGAAVAGSPDDQKARQMLIAIKNGTKHCGP